MISPLNIFLVRHGEAAARWHEASDPGLSRTGEQQAQTVLNALGRYAPMRIITSPLRRAQETAAPLAAQWGVPVEVDPRFREVPGPRDLGARPAWIAALMQAEWPHLDASVQTWRATLWSALCGSTEASVIFTHFMVINAVVSAVQGTSHVVAFEPDYCSVTWLKSAAGGVTLHALGRARTSVVL